MSLEWVEFTMPTVAATVSTLTKSVHGNIKKIVVNRDTNNFTLDVDLTNQNGTKEVILNAVAVTADTAYPVRVQAVDSAAAAVAGVFVEQTCNGAVTVDVSGATNGDDHKVWILVDKPRS